MTDLACKGQGQKEGAVPPIVSLGYKHLCDPMSRICAPSKITISFSGQLIPLIDMWATFRLVPHWHTDLNPLGRTVRPTFLTARPLLSRPASPPTRPTVRLDLQVIQCDPWELGKEFPHHRFYGITTYLPRYSPTLGTSAFLAAASAEQCQVTLGLVPAISSTLAPTRQYRVESWYPVYTPPDPGWPVDMGHLHLLPLANMF